MRDLSGLSLIIERSVLGRIGFGVAAAAVAVLLRAALDPVLGDLIPWVTFFAAVLVSALVGDVAAGTVTLGLCAVLGSVFFVSPRWALVPGTTADLASLGSFIVNGGFVGVVGVTLRRTLQMLRMRTRESRAAAEALRAGEAKLREQIEDLKDLHEFGTRIHRHP